MAPYLEAPDIWPDFHDALVNSIRVDLNGTLPPPYYARSQKRAESGVALAAGPVHTDPFRHRFVEIRDASRNHKLVTVIEIISPANKQHGPDRRSYEAKQREILESDANLTRNLNIPTSVVNIPSRNLNITASNLNIPN